MHSLWDIKKKSVQSRQQNYSLDDKFFLRQSEWEIPQKSYRQGRRKVGAKWRRSRGYGNNGSHCNGIPIVGLAIAVHCRLHGCLVVFMLSHIY